MVDIVAVGNTRIITPAGESWDQWFDGPGISDDFMLSREQPADQEQQALGMDKYMLDTNIVIYTIKNRPERVREAFKKHDNQMCISSVTYGELIYGAECSSQPERSLADIEGLATRLEGMPMPMV